MVFLRIGVPLRMLKTKGENGDGARLGILLKFVLCWLCMHIHRC